MSDYLRLFLLACAATLFAALSVFTSPGWLDEPTALCSTDADCARLGGNGDPE